MDTALSSLRMPMGCEGKQPGDAPSIILGLCGQLSTSHLDLEGSTDLFFSLAFYNDGNPPVYEGESGDRRMIETTTTQ